MTGDNGGRGEVNVAAQVEHVGLGNLRGRERANLGVVPAVTQVINNLVRVSSSA